LIKAYQKYSELYVLIFKHQVFAPIMMDETARNHFNYAVEEASQRLDIEALSKIEDLDSLKENFIRPNVDQCIDQYWALYSTAKKNLEELVARLNATDTGRCTAEVQIDGTTLYTSNARANALCKVIPGLSTAHYSK